MVDESHSYSSPTGSGAPDPVAAEQKPPTIRTMRGDLSNAKSGGEAKPSNTASSIGVNTSRPPVTPKNAPAAPKTEHVQIPEPPAPPKTTTPKPPSAPKSPEIPKREPPKPPIVPTPAPQPTHVAKPPDITSSPIGAAAPKPSIPAMTASLKPIAPKPVATEVDDETIPEGPALAEDELLSTEETGLGDNEEILDITKGSKDGEGKKPKKGAPKKALIFALIAVVLFAILGGGGYFAYSQGLLSFLEKKAPVTPPTTTPPSEPAPEPEPEPEPKPVPEPEPLPEPLIATSGTLTIGVTSVEEARTELTQRLLETSGEGITVIYLTSTETLSQLSFNDSLVAAGISMPNDVLDALDTENYTLFITSENNGTATRLGLVVTAKDVALLDGAMLNWESTMVADTDKLMRTLGKDPEIAVPEFSTNTRDSIDIRFINFPNPTLSLDYAIAQDAKLLLLGTSRSNIFMALDAL